MRISTGSNLSTLNLVEKDIPETRVQHYFEAKSNSIIQEPKQQFKREGRGNNLSELEIKEETKMSKDRKRETHQELTYFNKVPVNRRVEAISKSAEQTGMRSGLKASITQKKRLQLVRLKAKDEVSIATMKQ